MADVAMSIKRVVVEIERVTREVLLVAHAPFGGIIARPVDAKEPRELVWLKTSDARRAERLVCGPSFIALLEVFPDEGELPIETAAAIHALLAPPPGISPSLQALRFDVDARVFRWSRANALETASSHGPDRGWRDELSARLIGQRRPSFDRLYSSRSWAAFALSPPAADVDIEAGTRQLAGIVAATLGERLRAERDQREQWWLHEGEPGDPLLGAPAVDNDVKARRLFATVDVELAEGRPGAARMNIKLATIYDPQRPRFRRVLALLDG